jgi:hypothetical protein
MDKAANYDLAMKGGMKSACLGMKQATSPKHDHSTSKSN